jgi:pyridoxine/pyridoxamine 5'-phosphate oxidase
MRNIDPFERKRRLAMQDKLSEDFSSRKVTSRREVNASKQSQSVSPSEYLNFSRESYANEYER